MPGPIFIGTTVGVLAIGIVGSSQPDLGFLTFMSVCAALTIGAVWLTAFAIAANNTQLKISRRTWARWATPPAAFFLAVTVMASGLPAMARFEFSRSALEQAAARAQAGDHYGAGWIGLESVYDVRVVGGTTLFVLTQPGSGGCTLAYARVDNADLHTWLDNAWGATDYGHGWWYACDGYSD